MLTPEIRSALLAHGPSGTIQVALLGIETHICVLQTSLSLLREGFQVHVRPPVFFFFFFFFLPPSLLPLAAMEQSHVLTYNIMFIIFLPTRTGRRRRC
jgi:hypothetical protein